MAVETPAGHFYLGAREADDQPLLLEASDLTTHGVIVGMTGSGKTGLGVVMLEEALLSGIPALIIDPKGDMGNLMLSFPNLLPTDFMPWISESEAAGDVANAAVQKAELWKAGLQRAGIEPSRIKALHEKADFSIYTPGSSAGIPLNVIGSLRAPAPGTDPETLQDEIEGFASSLLGLVGIDSDPLSSREHILLSNIIHWHWSQSKDLDLGMLIGLVQQPPMRKLGVIDLDTFFPPADRVKLAMKLNGLAASPAFASWCEGPELDIQQLLHPTSGKAQAAIVCLSHLSEAERQFVVTLLLSKMVTWMRAQPGTGDLRALIYMDEVFGFVPPVGAPPSKKPILTILKQARAFGVGLVLSTQNPVDIDYKAISNAGTWMIGRLQTDRDKQRLLDGMGSSDGSVDVNAIGDRISRLDKRQFVLHSTRFVQATTFSTRWAMSYLAGPLTRDQISQLTSDEQRRQIAARGDAASASASSPADSSAVLADNESTIMPRIADNVNVRYLDPSVPYAELLGASADGRRLQAGIAVRVHMLFDDTRSKLRHESEWEAIITPLEARIDGDDSITVDYDDRDLRRDAPANAIYLLPDAKIQNKTYFRSAQRAIKDHLYRNQELTLFHNASLDAFSRIGESRSEFELRCQTIADEKTDADANRLREVLASKTDRLNDAIQKSEDKLRELQFDAASRKQDQRSSQVLDIAGGILGSLLGGRRSTRSIITGGIRRSQSKGRMVARAEERLKTAENRYNELLEDRDELEDALSEDLFAIQSEWSDKAGDITPMNIGLEKTDISIDDVSLVWIPRH
ncbi:MAG: ATP-binding protein [Granulosicoccus sp.]|nr:ATP-binding protein [Granulosicoccus sp.]